MTTNLDQPAVQSVDAWKLLRALPTPGPFLLAYDVVHQDGRTGVMNLLPRSHAGPDGGQGVVDVLARLERVTDARVLKPLATGFAHHGGLEALYVVVPKVDGAALKDLLGDGGLLPNEVVGLVVQVAEALAAAHVAGVPHGNLSLTNVTLLPGRTVAVGGFGLAPWPPGTAAPQRPIPSPELRKGGQPTFAGDVFALALAGAGLCAGPDALKRFLETAAGTEAAEVMPALEKSGKVPQDVVRALVGALHPDPVARPSAQGLASQLRSFAAPLPELAPAPANTPAAAPADGKAQAGVSPRVDAWLGEKSDPRRQAPPLPAPAAAMPAVPPIPPPAAPVPAALGPAPISGITSLSAARAPTPAPSAGNPFAASPRSGFEEVAVTESSIVGLTSEALPPVPPPPPGPPPMPPPTGIENTTLPPPPGAFLEDKPKGLGPLPSTEPEGLAPTPPGSNGVPHETGPVVLNLAALPIAMPRGGDFPVVARWTEGKGNKAPTPVEYIRPTQSGTGRPTQGPPPTRLMALLLVLGLALGLLAGRAMWRTAGGAQGAAGEPGTVQVASSLADSDVDITVELDGRTVGKAPVTIPKVTPGHHVVVLRAEGAEPAVVPLEVTPGKMTNIRGAPEFFAARLVVTSTQKGVTVARDEDKPVELPAEFEDLDPDTDVKLTFQVGRETVVRKVRVPAGELHFHLDLTTVKEGGAEPSPGLPPPPPPPPPPDREDRPNKKDKGANRQDAKDALDQGNKALLAGNFDAAVDALTRALKLDPSLAEAHKGMAIAAARQGRTCDSVKSYRRYLELRPNAPDVDRVRGILRDLEAQSPDCK